MENKNLPKRVGREVNHLDIYSSIFSNITKRHQHGERIEIVIEFQPWNQISLVKLLIPSNLIQNNDHEKISLINVSRAVNECGRFPVEIGHFNLIGGIKSVKSKQLENSTSIKGVIDYDSMVNDSIVLEFEVWEVVGQQKGFVPYLVSSLDIELEFGSAIRQSPAVVMLKTPKSVTPRSTQGNHLLAYPSKTTDEKRVLPLYFLETHKISVRYTCGSTEGLLKPWESLARSSVSSILVFILLFSSMPVSGGSKSLLALIAAFVATLQVTWEAVREVAILSIYQNRNNTIPISLLSINVVLIGIFSLALASLCGVLQTPLKPLCWSLLVFSMLTIIMTIIGFLFHSKGAFHSYYCDYFGCQKGFGFRRRGRVECRYTGRVFCDDHIDKVCQKCHYAAGLKRSKITSDLDLESHQPECLS